MYISGCNREDDMLKNEMLGLGVLQFLVSKGELLRSKVFFSSCPLLLSIFFDSFASKLTLLFLFQLKRYLFGSHMKRWATKLCCCVCALSNDVSGSSRQYKFVHISIFCNNLTSFFVSVYDHSFLKSGFQVDFLASVFR